MSLSWTFPYPSQRMPVFARNVVATSQPLAAQAGLQMLVCGGNAVDAAIAAAITLTVVEPTSNGLGSDAFAVIWDGTALHGLNGSGRSPRGWSPERFAGRQRMPQLGWDSVTVPGAVDAWSTLSRRFGKIPFADLFEVAIRYARDGYLVTPFTADRWASATSLYRQYPDFALAFLPNNRAPGVGELFQLQDLSDTLKSIAETEGESFYRGCLAEQIVQQAAREGGAMTLQDLDEHRSQWVEPLARNWQGVTLHELPPNGQGIIVLMALAILEKLDIASYPPDSPDSFHLQIEAMKASFALASPQIADPDWMNCTCDDLLDDALLAEKAHSIVMDRASQFAAVHPNDGGTVYLTTADASGMMVSYIQSNYRGFGSGIVIPETGISLQNRGTGFTLETGHPNQVDGSKRPYHTIIPAFVTKNGSPLMGLGVMGAHMQAQGHLQMMVRIFCWGQNPQTAVDAPRWYIGEDGSLSLEPAFPLKARKELKRRGHILTDAKPTSLFGGAQLAYRLDCGYCAASDPRKDGQAVGF